MSSKNRPKCCSCCSCCPVVTSTEAGWRLPESPFQRQRFDPTFLTPRLESNTRILTVLHRAAALREWGERGDEERLSVQDFPFEKKWGSPITQDTTCLMTALSHYGLLMWLSVGKLPALPPPWWISPWLPNVENGKRSFLLNFPATAGKKQPKKQKQTAMIWRGCFAHNFTAIQCTFICWNTRLRDRYIKISHGWLQTEAFLKFCLIAIYACISLGTRLDDNGPGLNAAVGWNVSHFG